MTLGSDDWNHLSLVLAASFGFGVILRVSGVEYIGLTAAP